MSHDPVSITNVRLPGGADPLTLQVSGGRVTAIGPSGSGQDAGVERVDADGRTVLPGLGDAHVHVTQWAANRQSLDLARTTSAREAAEAVARAVGGLPSGAAPLVGHGFRDGLWPDVPHRELLDAVAADRPVLLRGADLHTAWLNSAALQLVGQHEHPTGVLLEEDCYRAVAALPAASPEELDTWVLDAMQAAARRGVTRIIDFEIGDCLPDWERRARLAALPLRVACTVYRSHLPAAVTRGMPSGTAVPGTGGLVTVGPLKLFVDGSLNSRTALCHDPYPDAASGGAQAHGRLETPPGELVELMREAAAHGLTTAIHAIGDHAVAIALDAYEQTGLPGRIEHAQMVAPQDVRRFARPGLVAGVQPAHAPDDRDVADRHWAGRTARAFPYAELAQAGATLEFGSDAPVAPLDPWDGIASAVGRSDDDRPAWHPEQCLDVQTALRASCGGRISIEVGDPADLVLLDRDPLGAAPAELRDPGVAATMVDGRWTHQTL